MVAGWGEWESQFRLQDAAILGAGRRAGDKMEDLRRAGNLAAEGAETAVLDAINAWILYISRSTSMSMSMSSSLDG